MLPSGVRHIHIRTWVLPFVQVTSYLLHLRVLQHSVLTGGKPTLPLLEVRSYLHIARYFRAVEPESATVSSSVKEPFTFFMHPVSRQGLPALHYGYPLQVALHVNRQRGSASNRSLHQVVGSWLVLL